MRRIFNIYRRAYSGLPRGVWLLALVMLVNRGGSMVLFFITLYLTQEMAYSVAAAGQLVSLYGLGSLAGAFLGGWLSDRWGAKWVQIASLALSGIGFIILAYLTTPLQIGAMLFLVALGPEIAASDPLLPISYHLIYIFRYISYFWAGGLFLHIC